MYQRRNKGKTVYPEQSLASGIQALADSRGLSWNYYATRFMARGYRSWQRMQQKRQAIVSQKA